MGILEKEKLGEGKLNLSHWLIKEIEKEYLKSVKANSSLPQPDSAGEQEEDNKSEDEIVDPSTHPTAPNTVVKDQTHTFDAGNGDGGALVDHQLHELQEHNRIPPSQ